MNLYKQEEIRKARKRCLFWTLAVIIHAVFGIYYFVTNPADAVGMMILVPLIVPSLPLLGYFLVGLFLWIGTSTAFEASDKIEKTF